MFKKDMQKGTEEISHFGKKGTQLFVKVISVRERRSIFISYKNVFLLFGQKDASSEWIIN